MQDDARWPVERATAWWQAQPWFAGCNFIPSTAINPLEMWQPETFDPETIERELGWAADLGFDAVRVYLHDLLFDADPDGFRERIDRFLALASAAGIHTTFVLFDDVWNPEPRLGPQPAPQPGRHNSGWVASPGLPQLERYPGDAALRARLERYVRGVVEAFAHDPRVALWDLYNEPGGFPAPGADPVGAACLPLLADAFRWVREVAPDQPLTSGVWEVPNHPLPSAIAELQWANSDIVSFHHYGPVPDLLAFIERLRARSERPLLCTEYLARPMHSCFESHLPIFREHDIGAIHWGLVAGKTQTIHPWWSWFEKTPVLERDLWFHDLLHPDGRPFDPAEAAFLRSFLSRPAPHLGRIAHEVAEDAAAETIFVVAGLPRTGTSMLMQMLAAGGVPILSDGERQADEDNPKGYLELEAAKGLRDDASFLDSASGQAVKIVAQLLPYLPSKEGRRYRILFTQRDLDEVMASQGVMLERSGHAEAERDDAKLRETFHRQLVRLRALLARRGDFDTLFVHYAEVVSDPSATAGAVADFLGRAVDTAAMADAVDASLHRQRG